MEDKTQKENNNDEGWMKEHLEFYDNTEGNNKPKDYKKLEEYKNPDIHYRIYRYEILLIIAFICSIYLLQKYEINYHIRALRLMILYFLASFSKKFNLKMVDDLRDLIRMIFINWEENRLFCIFSIITLIYYGDAISYLFNGGGIHRDGDLIAMFSLLIVPVIGYYLGYFTKSLYYKNKAKDKK